MTFPTAPTAQLPMPGGAKQLRLIEALESHPSFYQLCLELPRLAKELRQDAGCVRARISTTKTCEDIEKDPFNGCWDMVILLHSMSRKALRSIILGTLAHDFAGDSTMPYEQPSQLYKGAGIYVIGLSRKGTQGEFLNERELETLVKGLERYVEGWKAIQSKANLTADERDAIDWVKLVDNVIPEPGQKIDSSVTKFIPQSASDDVITNELIRGFRARITKLDPTGLIRQIQSPLYVGCTVDLRERLAVYNVSRGVKKINKPLGLTISVLKASGIEVVMVKRVVLRTWKEEQLSLGERLVATLAGSMVGQTGFNATQAGANVGSQVTAAVKRHGLHAVTAKGYLDANSIDTEDEIDRREDFLKSLAKANVELDQLETKVDEWVRLEKSLDSNNFKGLQEALRELDTHEESLLNRLQEMKEKEKFSSTISDMLRSIDIGGE